MTPTDTGVSEELVEWAQRKYLNAPGSGAEAMRLVLNAIAPRLKAEGLREAAAELHYDDWRVAERLRARANALSQQVKETK